MRNVENALNLQPVDAMLFKMPTSSADDLPSALVLPHLRTLEAYTPGHQPGDGPWIKLNTNENPYPPSPQVAEAIRAVLAEDRLRRYPDPRSMALRETLAAFYGLEAGQVLVGNGSDDVLNLLIRTFADPRQRTVLTVPSYSLYPVLLNIQNGTSRPVPFTRDMKLPVDALLANPDATAESLLLLTSPNAPTGVAFPNEELRRLAAGFPGLLVVDEAYGEFAPETAIDLLGEFPRLAVTRSFSKTYGLAGLRLGYLLGHPDLIDRVDRLRDSYNVNLLSQAGGVAALQDRAYYTDVIQKILATRDAFSAWCASQNWFTYSSATNFVFTEPRKQGATGKEVARDAFRWLEKNRILVRSFPSHPLTESFLRITVGREEEMVTVQEVLKAWLET